MFIRVIFSDQPFHTSLDSTAPIFYPSLVDPFNVDTTLPAGGSITVSDGLSRGSPLKFNFSQLGQSNPEIFIKIIATAKSVDLSKLKQGGISQTMRNIDLDTEPPEIADTYLLQIVHLQLPHASLSTV